jgi:peroxidase
MSSASQQVRHSFINKFKSVLASWEIFYVGDNRVNDAPYMTVTQTSLFRQHNRVAEELAALNPHWGDERIYQESRRIVVAQWQHMVYNEYLPVLIGRKKMQELGIFPLQHGFSHDYDDKVNPSVLNEFTVTAFRFGHSLVPERQE